MWATMLKLRNKAQRSTVVGEAPAHSSDFHFSLYRQFLFTNDNFILRFSICSFLQALLTTVRHLWYIKYYLHMMWESLNYELLLQFSSDLKGGSYVGCFFYVKAGDFTFRALLSFRLVCFLNFSTQSPSFLNAKCFRLLQNSAVCFHVSMHSGRKPKCTLFFS